MTLLKPTQHHKCGALAFVILSASGLPALAQDRPPSYNLYGVPGLIDMPTAETPSDGTISTTVSKFGNNNRTTLTFQLTPRITGSFRYSSIQSFASPASVDGRYYDRSFDLRYRVLEETDRRPGVVIGLQDFIGTGLYGAEYVVATKEIAPGFRVTGGLGWGRLGSTNPIGSTGNRPSELLGQGGIPTYDRWFRGPFSAFGGVSYSPNERYTLKAEYSSDAYSQETTSGGFQRKSPWSFGIDYRLRRGGQLSIYHAYGKEIGVQFSMHTDLKSSPVPGGSDPAPVPVSRRNQTDISDLGWTSDNSVVTSTKSSMAKALERERLVYEGLTLTGNRAVLRLRNPNYQATSQAIGRAARVMTRVLPASVEELVIVQVQNGMEMSAATMRRTDVENLENSAAVEMLARTSILDGYQMAPAAEKGIYPKFTWSLLPYMTLSVFDPSNPIRADIGLRLSAKYQLSPNIVLSGAVVKRLRGDLTEVVRSTPSSLPKVRTNFNEYSRQGDPAIQHLTLTAYGRPGRDLYSRLTVGYLESMYAGVSGELLWKPIDSRLALGVELNYVKQREFKQMFGFRDYEVATGHVSAYYDFGKGFHGQLDVGRYLAGDYGATVALDREFGNGWRVGAYATFTNVAFNDFGEGSFDKGIRITMPISWASTKASRSKNKIVLQSLSRDGGARVKVAGRLYEQVRDYHRPELEKTWGRVWR